MKKIGILTFHRADNLGAVLQAFALQHTIEAVCDAKAEIIDYKCDSIESTKDIKIRSIKDIIKYIPMKAYYYIKHRGFEKFRKKELRTTPKTYDKSSIVSTLNDYDIFITGSDQVWNPDCSGNDFTYFLDFVTDDSKKVSFSASIGQYKFTDKNAYMASSLLKSFDNISVRESSALTELERMGITNGIELCDPVVLLDEAQWKQQMSERLFRGRYVLVYLVLDDVNTLACAQEYAKAHNCKIINNKKSIEFIMHNSPAEFLSWIYYADCVFTNSFHGTAFSLIFNKKLASDIYLSNGEFNHRVRDFLKKTDATQCEINDSNRVGHIPNACEMLRIYRHKGIEYLQSVIGE